MRGTSPKGHVRSHYDTVYGDMPYDLVVDAGVLLAQEIALQLQRMVEG